MPSARKPSRLKKSEQKIYESNAEQVLHAGDMYPSPRALRAARINAEAKRATINQRLPTIAEVQARYPFTEEAAEKFVQATKRALQKRSSKKSAKSTKNPQSGYIGDSPGIAPSPPDISLHLKTVLEDIRRRFGDEIRQRGEQTAVKEGFIYLVTHPCFEGWVKAGMTIDYELRLGTYNVADPLSRFEMVAIKWVDNRRDAEVKLLEALGLSASEVRGEWMRIELDSALAIFRTE